jgi:hypothetical protein
MGFKKIRETTGVNVSEMPKHEINNIKKNLKVTNQKIACQNLSTFQVKNFIFKKTN